MTNTKTRSRSAHGGSSPSASPRKSFKKAKTGRYGIVAGKIGAAQPKKHVVEDSHDDLAEFWSSSGLTVTELWEEIKAGWKTTIPFKEDEVFGEDPMCVHELARQGAAILKTPPSRIPSVAEWKGLFSTVFRNPNGSTVIQSKGMSMRTFAVRLAKSHPSVFGTAYRDGKLEDRKDTNAWVGAVLLLGRLFEAGRDSTVGAKGSEDEYNNSIVKEGKEAAEEEKVNNTVMDQIDNNPKGKGHTSNKDTANGTNTELAGVDCMWNGQRLPTTTTDNTGVEGRALDGGDHVDVPNTNKGTAMKVHLSQKEGMVVIEVESSDNEEAGQVGKADNSGLQAKGLQKSNKEKEVVEIVDGENDGVAVGTSMEVDVSTGGKATRSNQHGEQSGGDNDSGREARQVTFSFQH